MWRPAVRQLDHFAVGQRPGRAIGHVVERHHAANRSVCNLRVRSGSQELVHRTAFVGLHVPERDPAQTLERKDALDRLTHQREHRPGPGVEQQRLVVIDEELIEA